MVRVDQCTFAVHKFSLQHLTIAEEGWPAQYFKASGACAPRKQDAVVVHSQAADPMQRSQSCCAMLCCAVVWFAVLCWTRYDEVSIYK